MAGARPTTSPLRAVALAAALALLAVLPAGRAGAQAPAVAGAPDGPDQQGTARWPAAGPVIPTPELIEPIEEIGTPSRSTRLTPDGRGRLLVGGRTDVDGDTVERLVSLDAQDGSVVWSLDGIESSCLPVATDDGRVFATLPRSVPALGETTASHDPVEIDAATGTITNRYVNADTTAEPRLSECIDELRLGADGVLMAYTSTGYAVTGFDTTTTPMTLRWRTEVPGAQNDGALDRTVLSPDGTTLYVGSREGGISPPRMRIHAVDVATGAIQRTTTVPGTLLAADGLLHTGEALLVLTTATGGQDDPPRLMALDPQTLEQRWLLTGGDDQALDRTGRMAVSGDVVVVHASGTLIGVDLSDGTVRWSAELTSFSNNGSQIVADGAGLVYASTFGGAVLEIHEAATGDRVHVTAEEDELLGTGVAGEATLGPILDDGRLYALHSAQGGAPALVAYGTGTARLDGGTGDPIDIAIQLCQYLFDDGRARTVVLSRDDVFADTLAGAPLAGDHSCILFTPGGPAQPIDPRTAAEIARALPPGGTVRIAGGTAAVSQQVEDALQADGFAVERLAGVGRIQTAVAIADVVVAGNPGLGRAVVAFAADWPDAVTAGAAASAVGAPVLLTGSDQLPPDTADALARYGVSTTTVAGGTAVVSDTVLAQVPGGQRVAGPTRHGTAVAVARSLWAGLAAGDAFVLANLELAQGWALALAASPLSVRLGAPQLGVRAGDLPAETRDHLVEAGISDPGLLVLGDLTVIDDEVVQSVEAAT